MLGADWTCTDKTFCVAIWSWVEIFFRYSHIHTQSPTHAVAVMNPKSQTKRRSLLTMSLIRRLSFRKKRPPRAVSLCYNLFLRFRSLLFFFFSKSKWAGLVGSAALLISCFISFLHSHTEQLRQGVSGSAGLETQSFTLWCFHSCASRRLSSLTLVSM